MSFILRPQTRNFIFIQSNDSKMSSLALSQSVDIITKRLQSFSREKFEIKTIPCKNQIQVVVQANEDLKLMENLITQKGALEFYEAYTYGDFTKLFMSDSSLVKVFHTNPPPKSSPGIGCITVDEMNSVVKYLNSAGLNGKCKFTRSNFSDKPDVCLYALLTEPRNRILLTGLDIQSFEAKQDADRQTNSIMFKFKSPAIKVWAEVTKRNIDRPIAIVLDNKVLYSPVVRDEITAGNCEISGDFTKFQLKYIVAIGSNGELPSSFQVVK